MVETNPLKSGLLVVSPEDFAWQALDTLGLTSQTPECLRHAVQVLSWGNPRQRAGCDSPWPGSTSPQKGGDVQRRSGPPPRAGEPGEEMGDSRMGGRLDPWYLSFPGFPADHLPAQLVFSQSLGIKAFISVGELE